MNRTSVLALALGAAASAVLGSAGTAHAAPEYLLFTDPTGNVKCEMTLSYNGDPYANCVVRHAAYPVLADKCDVPGPANPQLTLRQGSTPDYSCVVGSDDTPGEFTLDLGQTRSVGTITCDSEDFGVTCTDAGTGHYFRAWTGSYDLG
ncbi:hypothetical protein DVS77_30615 [Mycolicibacterium moriokaense]|nr:hypothetical protein DVS77_30615 [Mycolicibacterium moriokaense]